MPARRLLLAGLCIALCAGCGPSGPAVVPVKGVVTLDGQPVADVGVLFMPISGGRPAEGTSDAQGAFSLTTEKQGDGAVVGDYNVTVTGVRTLGVEVNADGTSGDISNLREEWFVPRKYARPDTSGLRQTVSKDMPPVELKLSSK